MDKKPTILITGANGQLGMEFRSIAHLYPDFHFLFANREELPINVQAGVDRFFANVKINYCINCAAYTAVDNAEIEKNIAFEINASAVGNLAKVCAKNNTALIHFSTDYVFNGESSIPYKETDETDPVNTYGASKLAGEIEALKNNGKTIIIRTSWVYSPYGKNFVKTMLRLMKEKSSINVVDDQLGIPTYANDLALAVMQIINNNAQTARGVFNFCNSGITSWYGFALAIKNIINSDCHINPVPTSQFSTPAKRPAFSVLDTELIEKKFNLVIPYWKDSLGKCVALLEADL